MTTPTPKRRRLFTFKQLPALWHSGRVAVATAWQTDRRTVLAILAVALVNAILPGLEAWVGKETIDVIVAAATGDLASFTPILIWIGLSIGVGVTHVLVSQGLSYFRTRLTLKLQLHINTETLRHAGRLDLAHFEDPDFQDAQNRARENIGGHVALFVISLINIAALLLQSVTIFIVIIVIDPFALWILLPLAVPFLWLQWRIGRQQYVFRFKRATQRRWIGYITLRIMDRRFVPEVKLMNLAPLFRRRYERMQRRFLDEDLSVAAFSLKGNTLLELIFVIASFGIMGYAGWRVLNGFLTVGELVVYGRAATQLQHALQGISSAGGQVATELLYVKNWTEFMAAQPTITGDAGAPLPTCTGAITIDEVTFTYPGADQPTLHDIQLHIEPGETVALVGSNGAGKTTLVRLIARLYDVDKGRIAVDGHDVRDVRANDLWHHIAYVAQNFNHFEGTVADNIAFGHWEQLLHDRDAVRAVAQEAQIDDMIEALPQGYDTFLGRRFGRHDLSGGQWQKIAFARALARGAPILILDEPTANLDPVAEQKLLTQFKQAARQRTTILISHRFTTVELAERVVVIEAGRIVADGPHERLMAENAKYAALYRAYWRGQRAAAMDERRDVNVAGNA